MNFCVGMEQTNLAFFATSCLYSYVLESHPGFGFGVRIHSLSLVLRSVIAESARSLLRIYFVADVLVSARFSCPKEDLVDEKLRNGTHVCCSPPVIKF